MPLSNVSSVLVFERTVHCAYPCAREAPRSPAVELHVSDLQHDEDEACETCHTNGTKSFSGRAFGTSSSREGGTEWSTFSKCVELEPS